MLLSVRLDAVIWANFLARNVCERTVRGPMRRDAPIKLKHISGSSNCRSKQSSQTIAGHSLFSLLFSYWYTKRSRRKLSRKSSKRKFHLLVCFFPLRGAGPSLNFPTVVIVRNWKLLSCFWRFKGDCFKYFATFSAHTHTNGYFCLCDPISYGLLRWRRVGKLSAAVTQL